MNYLFIILIIVFAFYFFHKFRHNKNVKLPTQKFDFIITDEIKEIINLLKTTNESIFITGKAGTGKSSLLKHFIKSTRKKYVVLAPTGIAALNVSGQTIHSFFRFPPTIINPDQIQPDYVRAELFKNLGMVIIDEVSMVRADLMNGIDIALRKNRNRINEPFGGVQMIFIGDLFQLPPVLTDKDRYQIIRTYGGQYFFDAPVFKSFKYNFSELTTIFRQSEEQYQFKTLLNHIRNNEVSFEDMALLNSRHKDNKGEHVDSIFLTSRKNIARQINKDKLENLPGKKYSLVGTLSGKYAKDKDSDNDKLDDNLPAPHNLELKIGAQVMMLRNDPAKRWVNGSIGKIVKIDDNKIVINLYGNRYNVEKESWKEVEFVLNNKTKEIEEKIIAGFSQFPIQLAYAMTIHKSQGKTFDKITIDIGSGAFAHGQIYVALSRCKTLEGIILNNPIQNKDIIVDPRVIEYYKTNSTPVPVIKPEPQDFQPIILNQLKSAIDNGSTVKILYENLNGETTERILSNLQFTDEFNTYGYNHQHIKAYCHLRKDERNFKIERIREISVVNQ
ncbi:MAG: AAA family ATPase [Ignavibacteriales bacterium]|nr:MAG: AAA family ATPase [Ignavibacteriales bacterium]